MTVRATEIYMKAITIATTVLIAAALPALAADVTVDWDGGFDFTQVQTVAWGDGGTPAGELNQLRIEAAVEREIGASGLTFGKPADADLLVVTHAAKQTATKPGPRIGVGIGRSTGFGGISVGGSTSVGSSTIEVGSLVIQLRDRATGNLVWEAHASDTLSRDPKKLEAAIDKAVAKAFKKFPPQKGRS